jgi:hypothetical protein
VYYYTSRCYSTPKMCSCNAVCWLIIQKLCCIRTRLPFGTCIYIVSGNFVAVGREYIHKFPWMTFQIIVLNKKSGHKKQALKPTLMPCCCQFKESWLSSWRATLAKQLSSQDMSENKKVNIQAHSCRPAKLVRLFVPKDTMRNPVANCSLPYPRSYINPACQW